MYTVGIKTPTGITTFIIPADSPNASAVTGYMAFYLASTGALVCLVPNSELAYCLVTPAGIT
jgi:hypothetical protein